MNGDLTKRASFACFATPVLDPAMAERSAPDLPKRHRPTAAERDPTLAFITEANPVAELARFRDSELEALARLMPNLLCGEESAVLIFRHEAGRYGRNAATEHVRHVIEAISYEEERHELILGVIRDALPVAPDEPELQARARQFFTKLGFRSSDPLHRLNHIGALDRCVSLTLGASAKMASVRRSPVFAGVVARIRKDEARHVKLCLGIMEELGVNKRQIRDADDLVRAMYIDLMTPVSDAFEQIGVDADRLFKSLRRAA